MGIDVLKLDKWMRYLNIMNVEAVENCTQFLREEYDIELWISGGKWKWMKNSI